MRHFLNSIHITTLSVMALFVASTASASNFDVQIDYAPGYQPLPFETFVVSGQISSEEEGEATQVELGTVNGTFMGIVNGNYRWELSIPQSIVPPVFDSLIIHNASENSCFHAYVDISVLLPLLIAGVETGGCGQTPYSFSINVANWDESQESVRTYSYTPGDASSKALAIYNALKDIAGDDDYVEPCNHSNNCPNNQCIASALTSSITDDIDLSHDSGAYTVDFKPSGGTFSGTVTCTCN